MKKWLVYDHNEQAFNALKFFFLMMAQIFAIIYYETHNKKFKYCYYSFKFIGCAYKVFWDWHFDWGLFRGTKKSTPRYLRDKMKFPPTFYYCMMIFDVIALYFWIVIIFLYKYLENASSDEAIQNVEFFNKVAWLTWLELSVLMIRRTVWVLIRVENEFFSNFEGFRDIVAIPPMKLEKKE